MVRHRAVSKAGGGGVALTTNSDREVMVMLVRVGNANDVRDGEMHASTSTGRRSTWRTRADTCTPSTTPAPTWAARLRTASLMERR